MLNFHIHILSRYLRTARLVRADNQFWVLPLYLKINKTKVF